MDNTTLYVHAAAEAVLLLSAKRRVWPILGGDARDAHVALKNKIVLRIAQRGAGASSQGRSCTLRGKHVCPGELLNRVNTYQLVKYVLTYSC